MVRTQIPRSPLAPWVGDPALDPDQRCPGCGQETRFDPVMQKHIYQYRRCRECGVLYAIPRPSSPELLRRLTQWVENTPPLTPAQQEEAIHAMGHRVEWVRHHHPRVRTLLDIGAGNGAFLAAVRRAGLDSWGVELVPGSARFPGVEILVGDLMSLGLPRRTYDVITLWDTIEHLVDPLGMLCQAFTLLKEGGILIIETPNERGISARLRGVDWCVFGPADHLVMFSPKTLNEVMRKSGGRVEYMETRELCPWNDPGSSSPLRWPGRLMQRLRTTRPVLPTLKALDLGDWIFAVGRLDRGS